jgi:UDP-N-acetylglucosamine--N-acetylmuramyl-(pentapeptide) pyrophosphoryl-undecaprenol N-acetylglucosamine transferase
MNMAENDHTARPAESKIAGDARRELRVMVAGAGTGGHLFPGIAVVEKLMALMENVRACFVTTGRPIENTVLAEKPFETVRISAAGLKGFSISGKARSIGMLVNGVFAARRMLNTFKPHIVLGMGGYSSAPVVMAAWMMGIPRVIHEQNRIPGITNRALSRLSDRVYVSFEDTEIPGAKKRIRFFGYPVRPEILQAATASAAGGRKARGFSEKPMTVLVLGGSQGAQSINRGVSGAVKHLKNPGDFKFIHQNGVADEESVRRAYENNQATAVVSAFFKDMASLYQEADIAICRAGAGTLAEIAAARLPAILIPYPHAADNHQLANANGMSKRGGVRILLEKDMDPEALAGFITYYREEPDALMEMKSIYEKHAANNDAADLIARDILELAGFPQTLEYQSPRRGTG